MDWKKRGGYCVVLILLSVIAPAPRALTAQTDTDRSAWQDGYRQGAVYFGNKENDKAATAFREALTTVFPDGCADLPSDGQITPALLDDSQTAAAARRRQGLLRLSEHNSEQASRLFRDALAIVATRGARYIGYLDGCKSCHFKEWKSWKKTKMASAFETLKPGVKAEEKVKLDFDPRKDYTDDPNCLDCHTTGYGLPGGYAVPRGAAYKARKAAEQTMGATCEACHGPGSLYAPLHADVDENARPYRRQEFHDAGEHVMNEYVCIRCHNRRNAGARADFHFDFKEYKEKDTHENFPLMYRIEEKDAPAARTADAPSQP
jgi:hypothetical protein